MQAMKSGNAIPELLRRFSIRDILLGVQITLCALLVTASLVAVRGLDRSLHALVTDLHDRGLDEEVAVLVWGEFGRTPRINQFAGRDHWPDVGMAMFAGGGLKTGQVIGSTDRQGARPTSRPLSAQNVFATLYRLLGIDPGQTLPDFNGRPQFLLDDREPIAELF